MTRRPYTRSGTVEIGEGVVGKVEHIHLVRRGNLVARREDTGKEVGMGGTSWVEVGEGTSFEDTAEREEGCWEEEEDKTQRDSRRTTRGDRSRPSWDTRRESDEESRLEEARDESRCGAYVERNTSKVPYDGDGLTLRIAWAGMGWEANGNPTSSCLLDAVDHHQQPLPHLLPVQYCF